MLSPVPKKLDEGIACTKAHSCFIGKRFLGETFVPTRVCFVLDGRQHRRSHISLPSPENSHPSSSSDLVQESHSPVSTPSSKACESDTQEERRFGYPHGATPEESMENINFGVGGLGGLLQEPGPYRVPTSQLSSTSSMV